MLFSRIDQRRHLTMTMPVMTAVYACGRLRAHRSFQETMWSAGIVSQPLACAV